MNHVELNVLQMPKLYVNNELLVFPYMKSEALLYYLAVEKTSTREKIASMLWEDVPTDKSLKNLRHALYILRKTIGFDVILSDKRSKLTLNPEIDFRCDTTLLEQGDSTVYQGSFLENFSVKKSYAYEEWLEQKRESFRRLHLTNLFYQMNQSKDGDISELEELYHRYHAIDPFDERTAILLLQAFQRLSLYHKGIKIYEKLYHDMGDALGIVPGQDLTSLYRTLRKEWAEKSAVEDTNTSLFIHGRRNESKIIDSCYQKFLSGHSQLLLLSGEIGVGKTYLLQSVLNAYRTEDAAFLHTVCFPNDKNTPFSLWNSLLFQLENIIEKHSIAVPVNLAKTVAQFFPVFLGHLSETDPSPDMENRFRIRALQNGLLRIIRLVTQKVQVAFFLDNFHYADMYSSQLFQVLLNELSHNCLFLFTFTDTFDLTALLTLSQINPGLSVTRIKLLPFTREEIKRILNENYKDIAFDPFDLDEICQITGGNGFFLQEVLETYKATGKITAISQNTAAYFSERFSGLSTGARSILDIISLIPDSATLELLETMIGKQAVDILDNIEELKIRSLILESTETNTIRYSFRHGRLQEFIASQLSPTKQSVYHNSIGHALERELILNRQIHYNQLILHFTLGHNPVKAVEYKVRLFEEASINMFELYPSFIASTKQLDAASVTTFFIQIESELRELKNLFLDQSEYEELSARFAIAKARYQILSCHYPEGLESIKKSLALPFIQTHAPFLLKSLRQMVYYSIQQYNTTLMKEYSALGLTLAKSEDDWLEIALFLRLQGLYFLMVQNYEACRENLLQSLAIIEQHNTKNGTCIINLAAVYNYLGEMHRKQRQFDEAVTAYETAISLCEENHLAVNATFLTNLGCALLGSSHTPAAVSAFQKAAKLYEDSTTQMGRSITFGHLAIHFFCIGQSEKGIVSLKQAMEAAEHLSSPLEKGLLRRTQAEILYRYRNASAGILTEPLNFYIEDCKRLLQDKGTYELDDLKEFEG